MIRPRDIYDHYYPRQNAKEIITQRVTAQGYIITGFRLPKRGDWIVGADSSARVFQAISDYEDSGYGHRLIVEKI